MRDIALAGLGPLLWRLPFLERGEEPVDSAWAGGNRLAVPAPIPRYYGLVVVDRDTRWVGSAQGYSAAEEMALAEINRHAHEFDEAWREGRLSGVRWFDSHTRESTWQPWEEAAQEQGWDRAGPPPSLAALGSLFRGIPSRRLSSFTCAVPGWTFERFAAASRGLTGMVEALLDRGFVFPPGSGAPWLEYTSPAAPVDPEAMQAVRHAAKLASCLAPAGPSRSLRL